MAPGHPSRGSRKEVTSMEYNAVICCLKISRPLCVFCLDHSLPHSVDIWGHLFSASVGARTWEHCAEPNGHGFCSHQDSSPNREQALNSTNTHEHTLRESVQKCHRCLQRILGNCYTWSGAEGDIACRKEHAKDLGERIPGRGNSTPSS